MGPHSRTERLFLLILQRTCRPPTAQGLCGLMGNQALHWQVPGHRAGPAICVSMGWGRVLEKGVLISKGGR